MLAAKDNPKNYAAQRGKRRQLTPGEMLELTTENFVLICGLNGLRPSQIPGIIERTKQAIYKALRNPRSCPIVFDRLESVLPKRRLPTPP